MSTFAIQYLEPGPHITRISPQEARAKLRQAFDRLPLNMVLVGWNLPDALIDVCAEECREAGAALYRWHPLLTGGGRVIPSSRWQVIGLRNQPVAAYHGLPEFTFMCPNHPDARVAMLAHLRETARDERYDGLFLDRIRYPSPAEHLDLALGCFCEDCQRIAAIRDLDLVAVQACINRLAATADGCRQLVAVLLDPASFVNCPEPDLLALSAFLRFRFDTITKFVRLAADTVQDEGKAVGLDCFTPALTPLVGQDLAGLDGCADWIKPMSYAHTCGPAGMVFEFGGLLDWLMQRGGLAETEALALLSQVTGLPLPEDRATLQHAGLPPAALRQETARARATGVHTLLAGIELVEIAGVAELQPEQIAADVAALRDGGAAGLVLAWDLWHMPLDRLDIVREAWG